MPTTKNIARAKIRQLLQEINGLRELVADELVVRLEVMAAMLCEEMEAEPAVEPRLAAAEDRAEVCDALITRVGALERAVAHIPTVRQAVAMTTGTIDAVIETLARYHGVTLDDDDSGAFPRP